jgi:polar amino acid transport system permease protein
MSFGVPAGGSGPLVDPGGLPAGPGAPAPGPRLARGELNPGIEGLQHLPWWVLILLLAGITLVYKFATDQTYTEIFKTLALGLPVTIAVTVIAYALAIVLGLVAGIGRLSTNRGIYTVATLYVQVIRGVPILVMMFIVAFVAVPTFVGAINAIGDALAPLLGADNALAVFRNRDIGMGLRATVALAVAYGGYEAETFRAGIQSVPRGQMEAARSLGMTWYQSMRHIILPQAIQRILPTLGNDFIAMLKDSSLVSVLGVRDITQEARLYAASTFNYPPTYYSLAFMYLTLTLILSMLMKAIEGRMGSAETRG